MQMLIMAVEPCLSVKRAHVIDVPAIERLQLRNGRLDFPCECFGACGPRVQRIVANRERLEFRQRLAEVRQVLLVTDLVGTNPKLLQRLGLAFEALDFLNPVAVQIQHHQLD